MYIYIYIYVQTSVLHVHAYVDRNVADVHNVADVQGYWCLVRWSWIKDVAQEFKCLEIEP